MWWLRLTRPFRVPLAIAVAAPLAACFQPQFAQTPLSGGATVRSALASIDVKQIPAARGSPDERVAVELRNALLFDLTGGSGSIAIALIASAPSILLTSSRSSL